MQYYFNNLSFTSFQRLINGILVARFGEDIRLTPLYGADGGRDAETAPGNPFYEVLVSDTGSNSFKTMASPRVGRYVFQVKHHRTVDTSLTEARQAVLADFEDELRRNVLTREETERVNYFILVTNVPGSKDALGKLDIKRKALLSKIPSLHADVWWEEQVTAQLDLLPSLWNSFPEMFAGGRVPFVAAITADIQGDLPRAVRIAMEAQFGRDERVKFRQIDLEQSLSRLFVNVDVSLQHMFLEERPTLALREFLRSLLEERDDVSAVTAAALRPRFGATHNEPIIDALSLLLTEHKHLGRKIILEGGPGQGKSTVTQMTAQIYRQQVLGIQRLQPEGRWGAPKRVRLPFRVELRDYAEQISQNPDYSIEEYLAASIRRDSGGGTITVDHIHNMVEASPVMLILDGLDEIGSDDLRDKTLEKAMECVSRFEKGLNVDLKVVITTRPPAITGRQDRLPEFRRVPMLPLDTARVKNYVDRWLSVQLLTPDEKQSIQKAFTNRQREPHVQALIKNPMQLSVLLHFIRHKGEAFPDRRAELYREYFRLVIDRDVEKSPELRLNRDLIETLHQFIGYKIHALTEAEQADGSLGRDQMLSTVAEWLRAQGNDATTPSELFKLGEERLGLLVALKGEGEVANYGFEVQPIREYFAAAFINEQIRGNAHSVFEAMIRRPFWREVALFLAGLRRQNEKADLIARAKLMDSQNDSAWRQDGRSVTFQLLQEGVFSQPQHVFAEAMDFVMDLLDPRAVPVLVDPRGFLDALASLLRQDDARHHGERLRTLAIDFAKSNDKFAVSRLCRVITQAFPPEQARHSLLNYHGDSVEILTNVRIFWPALSGLDMSPAITGPEFWGSAPTEAWIESVWHAVFQNDTVTSFPLPVEFHEPLIQQLALNPHPTIEISRFGQNFNIIRPKSSWAIWILVRSQQLLRLYSANRRHYPDLLAFINKEIGTYHQIDYSGLTEDTAQTVRDIINVSTNILRKLIADGGEAQLIRPSDLEPIAQHLSMPGLTSWLAYQGIAAASIAVFEKNRAHISLSHPLRALRHLAREDPQWITILNKMSQFYQPSPELGNVSPRTMLPTHVRVTAEAEPVDIGDLLLNHLVYNTELSVPWLLRVHFESYIVRILVEKCPRQVLPRLLEKLPNLRFANLGLSRPLLTPNVQSILHVARNSDDQAVLVGALIALASSRFIKIAGVELVLKMLGSGVDNSSIVLRIFRPGYLPEPEQDAEQKSILLEVASRIVESPRGFSYRIACLAATYLSDNIHPALPPLMEEEVPLGIQV